MDPPPPTTDSTTQTEETLTSATTTTTMVSGGKLRLMCSYGGHIIPRPHDKTLCYVGGETRIVVIDRTTSLSDLFSRLSKTLINGRKFGLKYQLPNEDLDSLITISTDEDLQNMIDEYDHLLLSCSNSGKPGRIRLFLFPEKPDGPTSIGPGGPDLVGVGGGGGGGGGDWFVNSLNGLDLRRGFSDPTSVNCLLGLDNGVENGGGVEVKKVNNVEVQSVPDSPVVETNSSFGSTSSTPSMANLAPIRVHVEENGVRVSEAKVGGVGGIEDQFGQLGIGVNNHNNDKQVDDGFVALSSPPAPIVGPTVAAVPVPAGGMVGNGSELVRQMVEQPVTSAQTQQKQIGGGGGGELASPDSVASDNSLSNAINRQKPVMYQESVTQSSTGSNRLPPNMIDLNGHIQVLDSGYTFTPQYDPQQQQQPLFHYQQQQPLQPQQQQQQPLLSQQQPHHHPPAGAVPLSTFYQMYPPQQPHLHPNQYQVYYVPAGQAPAYHYPVQQPPNVGEPVAAVPSSHPQTPQNPTLITTSSVYNHTQGVPHLKPEMSGTHRVATATGPQLVQFPSSQLQSQSQSHSQPQPQLQQQYMGYSQINHQSQSIAPNSAANGAYAYDFVDAAHPQIYYTQPAAPPLAAAQYQAVTSGANMVSPDCSSPNANDNLKQQQVRSSQPS